MKTNFENPALKAELLSLVLAMTALGACAQKNETRTLTVAAFNSISVSGSFRVELRQGSSQSVTVTGDAATLDELSTEVNNGVWRIALKRKKNGWDGYSSDNILVKIVMPKLTQISSAGSADVVAQRFEVENITIGLAGSGKIVLPMNAKSVQASLAGSGDIILSGKATKTTFDIAGSGDIEAVELQAVSCKASIAGSGDVSINVSGTLEASIAGSGDVLYKGSPTVKSNVLGSGSVSAL